MTAFAFGYSVGIEKFANALAVRPLVGELMRRPAIRVLPNAVSRGTTTAAGNAMKYLGAAGAGMGVGGAAGYALGKSQAPVDTQKAATAFAAAAPRGLPEAVLRSIVHANPLTHAGLGAATYAPIGAAAGAYRAPSGQKLRGAGRGALIGAATGAGAGAANALATRGIGGVGGMVERSLAGGMKNNMINQLPIVAGLAGGVAGYQLAKQRPAAKQAGMLGDMTQAVKKKTEAVAGKANTAAKTVANKAVDAGKKMQAGLEKWRTSK